MNQSERKKKVKRKETPFSSGQLTCDWRDVFSLVEQSH